MPTADPSLAYAISDSEDRLLSADEPLAGLQRRCGGAIPGDIAVPALRSLVVKARLFGLKLARPIVAQDGLELIRAWVEVAPMRGEGAPGGCAITLRNWQASPLLPEDAAMQAARRVEIDRVLAELTARLDARQCLLTVESDAPDLAMLAAAMRAGLGRPWTDHVSFIGDSYRHPVHWRLLDGAEVAVEGSARRWRASLVPQAVRGSEPDGFELCLTADVPIAAAPAPAERPERFGRAGDGQPVVGREVAPVLRQPLARIIATGAEMRLADMNVEAALQVHDELVFHLPTTLVNICKRAIESEMTKPVDWMPNLPIAVEIGQGQSYGDAK